MSVKKHFVSAVVVTTNNKVLSIHHGSNPKGIINREQDVVTWEIDLIRDREQVLGVDITGDVLLWLTGTSEGQSVEGDLKSQNAILLSMVEKCDDSLLEPFFDDSEDEPFDDENEYHNIQYKKDCMEGLL